MKITEFSRQGPRAVCIISGSGRVSNVTLRHPNSSSGTLTYEVSFCSLNSHGILFTDLFTSSGGIFSIYLQ